MNLHECMLVNNRCYKTNATIKPRGVMVHSTGANNPWLRRYVQPVPGQAGAQETLDFLGVNKNGNSWNRSDISVCVHAFIGKAKDGSVATEQTLPWNHRGWHAGDGTSGKSANDTHISFEICEDGLTDPVYFAAVYKEATELVAHLCQLYNLDPTADDVIICHQDGYKMGIASNHGDIYNWFPKHGKNMMTFRNDVYALLHPSKPEPEEPTKPEEEDDMKYYKYYDDIPEYYQGAVLKAMSAGALNGVGKDDDGVLILNVSEDMCRILTVLDRLGNLD